jgi:hypothetical protein
LSDWPLRSLSDIRSRVRQPRKLAARCCCARKVSDFGNFELFAAHPREEAQGFKALLNLEDPKYNIEQIAAKVGKSPAYCAARVCLMELVAPVIEAFYAEEIGIGHALLRAKLQPRRIT